MSTFHLNKSKRPRISMTALRILLIVLVLLGAGFAALVVMGSSLEPQTATVEVTLPDDSFAE
jgi:hypothetical protein